MDHIHSDREEKTREKFLELTLLKLKQSQEEKKPYEYKVFGRDYLVWPGVFSLSYFPQNCFFTERLPIEPGEEFCDMGCGMGIASVEAVLKGAARSMALDINKAAVRNTLVNARRFNLQHQIEVLHSDLFSQVPFGRKFDRVFWNAPFFYTDREELSDLEYAVLDPGYRCKDNFLMTAKKYLKVGGCINLGFCRAFGRMDLLEKMIKRYAYSLDIVDELVLDKKGQVKFELFELRPLRSFRENK